MSEQMTQKISELLRVLIFLVLICMFIFVCGLLTRPSTEVHYIYINKSSEMKSPSSLWKIKLAKAIFELRASIEEETQDLEVPLEGAALIDSYIYEITSEHYPEVDPDLIRAIVQTESHYDPSKINPRTGVQGLCQINPKWHMPRALSLGVTDLLDPYGNLLVCCDLLNELYQDYPRDYALDLYAGGYPYANSYIGTKSPHTILINDTIAGLRDGRIVPGE